MEVEAFKVVHIVEIIAGSWCYHHPLPLETLDLPLFELKAALACGGQKELSLKTYFRITFLQRISPNK